MRQNRRAISRAEAQGKKGPDPLTYENAEMEVATLLDNEKKIS